MKRDAGSDETGESQKQPDRLRILSEISAALNEAPDVREALSRALSLASDLLGLKTGWVWLLDAETDQFFNAAVQNLPPYLQEPVRMTGSWCWCLSLFRSGELTPANVNLIECSRLQSAIQKNADGETMGLRFHASIPLYFHEKPLGVMNVAAPTWRELTQDELNLLSAVAHLAGAAIERFRLAEESLRLARAEERTRLAREIHDTLAQDLTAIILHVESAMANLTPHPERAEERLRQALQTATGSLEEARRSVMNLRSAPLAGKSLEEALIALSRTFTSETGIRAYPNIERALSLPLRTEAELFRIAQEALTNVRKHSKATEVRIALKLKGNSLTLVIEDNGQGFDSRAPAPKSQGILGMRERAAILGGKLKVRGGSGEGTRITASVPLMENRDDTNIHR